MQVTVSPAAILQAIEHLKVMCEEYGKEPLDPPPLPRRHRDPALGGELPQEGIPVGQAVHLVERGQNRLGPEARPQRVADHAPEPGVGAAIRVDR